MEENQKHILPEKKNSVLDPLPEKTSPEKAVLPPEGSLLLSPSPHIRTGDSSGAIMLKVMLCLLPAVWASVFFFGWNALRVIVLCMGSCAALEYGWCRIMKQPSTVRDMSALLTGLLLAMNLPASLPWYWCVTGSFFAVIVAKAVFGGLGQNPFNPAAVGRVALLIGAAKPMTSSLKMSRPFMGMDGVTSATPLTAAAMAASREQSLELFDSSGYLWNAFWGNVGGALGETSAFALLIGAVFLVGLKLIKLYIPLAILLTVTVFVWLVNTLSPGTTPGVLFHLLSGGLLLGTFFMATDYVTSPVTHLGGVVYGIGIGVIVCVIRIWGAYPEGMSFAIIIMNALVPLIDKLCFKRPFGWNPPPTAFQARRGEIR